MTEENIYILIVRYLTKEASAEEEKTLLDWLSQSEDNRRTFRSLKDAFDLGQLDTFTRESDVDAEWEKLLSRIKPAKKPVYRINSFRKILGYAAVFLLGLVCMKAIDLSFTGDFATKRYMTRIETGKGERSKVTLPDSTVVWLNACSSISYGQDFGTKTRKIDMDGEVYFEVRKDKSRPFSVYTGDLACHVTGTSFNIYSFDNDTIANVVLVEGSVVLEYGDYTTEVKPGEIIEFDRTTYEISRQQADIALYTCWRSGELMFEKMTFEELAKRLERNFNVTFVFENSRMKKESFGGTFRHYDSLETILKVISASTPVQYEIDQDVVYIR